MATELATSHETYMTTMTPYEWSQIPDNPRQRDTEYRAKKAKHLHTLEPSHLLVHMAEWEGGMCKLEGHTRGKVWIDMPEIAPDSIDVRVYVVADEEEAKRLYGHFNSKEEVETVTDRLYGSLREQNIKTESSLLSGCRFTNPCRQAHTYATKKSNPSGGHKAAIRECVAFFRDEIVAMDAMHFSKHKGLGCALCCYIMARRKHGELCDEFFDRYNKDEGIKNGKSRDCIQVFSDAVDDSRQKSGGGFTHFHDAVCIGLACVDRWIKDKSAMLSRAPKCDPYRYLD